MWCPAAGGFGRRKPDSPPVAGGDKGEGLVPAISSPLPLTSAVFSRSRPTVSCNSRSASGTPCPVAPDISITRLPDAFASADLRAAASRCVIASTLFKPISSGLSANPPPYAANSSRTVRQARTTSPAAPSTRCKSTAHRSICPRNRVPSPAPSDAPSINPGISASTNSSVADNRTTPSCGRNVVNG